MGNVFAICALLWTGTAAAQEGFDAHGFKLAAFEADPRDPLTLERPDAFEQGDWYAGSLLEYARAPLIRTNSVTGVRQPILDHIVAMNLSGGIAAHEYVRFGVSWPLFLTSTGGDLSGSGTSGQGVGVGDMRLNAMGTYTIPSEGGDWGVGLAPHLDLPLGKATEFLGQGQVAGGLTGSGTREMGSATLGANLGFQFNPSVAVLNANNPDGFLFGVHGGWLLDEFTGVNVELKTLIAMAGNDFRGSATPGELIASFRHQPDVGPQWVGGLATAFTPGAGAAAFRLMVGGAWGAQLEGSSDTDADGLVDSKDQCPDEPETINGYLEADGCPDRLPSLSVSVRYDGKPVSEATLMVMTGDELDEVAFTGDPVVREGLPGVEWAFEAASGPCLEGRASAVTADGQTEVQVDLEPNTDRMLQIRVTDADGEPLAGAYVAHSVKDVGCASSEILTTNEDGITSRYVGPSTHTVTAAIDGYEDDEAVIEIRPDQQDVSVDLVLSRVISADQSSGDGSEKVRIRVEPNRIAILERIQFETGRTTIQSGSHALLDELAQTIRNAPDIGNITIAGHTDSEGSEEGNQALSAGRAQAVLDYLVAAGVRAERLTAVGYGETRPIAPNRTESGRAQNRRVEFELEGSQ